MFRLVTLGGLSLTNSSASDVAIPRRKLALLALLAVAGDRGLSRDKLVAYFWPDGSADDARHSLEQLLYSVRQQLDGSVFRGTDPLSLNPAVITSDVAVLEDALARGADGDAVCAYTGDFLDGFYLNKATEFERWADEQRARLRMAYGAALERIAKHATQRNDWNAAIAAWRRLVALDRLSTRSVLGLVRTMAAAGDQAEALRTATAFEALVREELELPLDPALAAFLQELRAAPNGGSRASQQDPRISDRIARRQSADSTVEAEAPRSDAAAALPTLRRPRRLQAVAALLSFGVAVVAGVVWLTWPSPVPKKPRVAVVAFENRTGDRALDLVGTTTAEYISDALAQTGLLEVDGRSFDAWDPRNARPEHTPAIGDVVRRTGATMLVSGAYDKRGDALTFSGQVVEARTRTVLFGFDDVSGKELRDVLDQVRQRVVSGIAAHVDPALTPWVGNQGRPPVKFEAYQEFANGMTAFVNGIVQQKDNAYGEAGFSSAAEHLARSFRLDSTYYIAALWWFWARHNVGDLAGADSVLGILDPHRSAMSPPERALYDYNVALMRGTPQQRYEQDGRLVEFSPASEFRYCLARDAVQAHHPREALDVLKTLDERNYSWMRFMRPAPGFAVRALVQLGDYRGAIVRAQQFQRESPGDITAAFPEIDALAALDRLDEAEPLVRRFANGVGFPEQQVGNLMLYAGLRLQAASRADHARELFEDALALFSREPSRAKHDVMLFGRGRSRYYLGQWAEARAAFDTLARMSSGTTLYDWRALIYLGSLAARRGDTVEVGRIRSLLQKLGVNPADEHYFDARTLALLGQPDLALRFLADGVRDGAQVWQIMEEGDAAPSMDPDFARLRGSPQFRKAVGVW